MTGAKSQHWMAITPEAQTLRNSIEHWEGWRSPSDAEHLASVIAAAKCELARMAEHNGHHSPPRALRRASPKDRG